MNTYRHGDPAIAAWLDDAPAALNPIVREAIVRRARATRQVRFGWPRQVVAPSRLDRRAIPLALATALVIVLLAIPMLGGWGTAPPPAVSASPAPTVAPARTLGPGESAVVLSRPYVELGGVRSPRWLPVEVRYQIPVGMNLKRFDTRIGEAMVFFLPADSTGSPAQPSDPWDGPRGIVIADVTNTFIGPAEAPLVVGRSDAREFLRLLNEAPEIEALPIQRVALLGRVGYRASCTQLNLGRPAAPDDLRLAFLQSSGRSLEFARRPCSLIVVDIGGAIVAMQIWTASFGDDFNAWEPLAMRLVNSLSFRTLP